jgi:GNAT superfamily N-acetyltransferase
MQVDVRPMERGDLGPANRVLRDAFGAILGEDTLGDTDLLRTRLAAGHVRGLGAFMGRVLVGSALVTRWGSVGFVGPVSVEPALWGRGIGSGLLGAVGEILDGWGVTDRGLFTFAHSPRHHALYQHFGYWPRFLTALMSSEVPVALPRGTGWSAFSGLADRRAAVAACSELAEAVHPGLDLTAEIAALQEQKLGDVVLVGDPARPDAFAICHDGPGTEAGTGKAYVKFGAARPRDHRAFVALVQACREHASAVGARRLVVGVNTARHGAYRHLGEAGFRTDVPGVTMHHGNAPGYDRPNSYVLDDWR